MRIQPKTENNYINKNENINTYRITIGFTFPNQMSYKISVASLSSSCIAHTNSDFHLHQNVEKCKFLSFHFSLPFPNKLPFVEQIGYDDFKWILGIETYKRNHNDSAHFMCQKWENKNKNWICLPLGTEHCPLWLRTIMAATAVGVDKEMRVLRINNRLYENGSGTCAYHQTQ